MDWIFQVHLKYNQIKIFYIVIFKKNNVIDCNAKNFKICTKP